MADRALNETRLRRRGRVEGLQQGAAARAGGERRRASRSRPASSSRSKARAARARRRCSSCSARSTGRPGARCSSRAATSAKLRDGQLAELRLRAFGFVFQQFNLIPTLTALQNVELALAPTGATGSELREPLGGAARRGRARRPRRAPAGPALGRRAAARRDRPRARRRAARDPRRRADREPRLEDRRRRDRPARRARRRGTARRSSSRPTTPTSPRARPRRLAMRDGALVARAPCHRRPADAARLRDFLRCSQPATQTTEREDAASELKGPRR